MSIFSPQSQGSTLTSHTSSERSYHLNVLYIAVNEDTYQRQKMIAADVATMALLTPKLEIVSVDPNYVEYDWDDCRKSTSTSSSSGFRSHENDSEDLFEEDLLSQNHILNHAICNDTSITSDPIFEKILDEELMFSQDSTNFNKICFPIDAYDSYSNVVNWLDSTPVSPLFAKPIKITAENVYNLKVLPNLNQKQFEITKQTQAIKIESHTEGSGKMVVSKKSQLDEKSNVENFIQNQSTNGNYTDKSLSLIKSPSSHVNNILFEKNLIENTKRIKTSPVRVKKKLNLEEYLKRRPNLKLDLTKSRQIKQESNCLTSNTNEFKSEQENTTNTIQDVYEEIIVVSMGSNTDVTIPLNDDNLSGDLQSIKLISKKITDTIDGEQISSNSLIASIRDVIIKKNHSLNCSNIVPESIKNDEIEKELEHGEDKTIMHLKKDRVRVKCTSIGVQTDCNIRFPTLELWETTKINFFAKSKSRSRSTSSRSSFNSFGSDRRKRKRSNSPVRTTTARSNNNRSGSKQGFEKSYKRSRQETNERCTVYVGRIETTTSKDDLKKKFERYGPIREVSTHKKENGMKFGFVTFKSAKDAYNTIDVSTTDPAINVYDISFGGRRAFCKETYLDLDNIDVYQQEYTLPAEPQNDSFEDLLRKVKLEIKSSQKHIK